MAEKKFKDLLGMRVTCDDSEEVLSFLPRTFDPKKNECKIVNHGDHFYVLDKNNGYAPTEAVLLEIANTRKGITSIRCCLLSDLEKVNGYLPFATKSDDTKYNAPYMKYVHKCSVSRYSTHSGLYCTSLKVALELQKRILDGKCFCTTKAGDTLYCLYENTIFPIKVEEVSREDYWGLTFDCITCDKFNFRINDAMYETFISSFNDESFYIHGDGGKYKEGHTRIYISQKDAERARKESNARKAKAATDKYLKKLENYDGKIISHKDSFGNDLHYGDKVAFSIGTGGVPYISIGHVNGETKTKVVIIDDRTNQEVRPAPGAIVRIQLAKTNKESESQNYQYKTFVNAK